MKVKTEGAKIELTYKKPPQFVLQIQDKNGLLIEQGPNKYYQVQKTTNIPLIRKNIPEQIELTFDKNDVVAFYFGYSTNFYEKINYDMTFLIIYSVYNTPYAKNQISQEEIQIARRNLIHNTNTGRIETITEFLNESHKTIQHLFSNLSLKPVNHPLVSKK